MSEMEELTIVIAALNAAETLPTTLQSLENSLSSGARLILVNDGSTDRTMEVMERHVENWPKSKIIKNSDPKGAGIARNEALDAVMTKYVTVMDADDWVRPDYHRSLIQYFSKNSNLDFVRSSCIEAFPKERRVRRIFSDVAEKPVDPKLCIMPENASTPVDNAVIPAGMYSSEFLNKHFIRYANFHTAEDRLFIWKAMVLGDLFLVSDEYGMFYRRGRQESLTGIGDERQTEFVESYAEIFSFLYTGNRSEFAPKAIRQFLAISCFQIDRESRLTETAKNKMYAKIRGLLQTLPLKDVEKSLSKIDAKRRKIIQDILK